MCSKISVMNISSLYDFHQQLQYSDSVIDRTNTIESPMFTQIAVKTYQANFSVIIVLLQLASHRHPISEDEENMLFENKF